ncbi:MAG: hypothetical protein LBS61_01970 [Endomicrobium sp.]|nr:hypothetical protein [Endomicrobium sp.]
METIVKMAKNILKIFKSSIVETKNKILSLILWNFKLKEKAIDFSYRNPFDMVKNFKNGSIGVADGT